MSTPNVADDLAKLAASKGSLSAYVITTVGSTRNAWPGPERPSKGSDVPLQATFWEVAGGTTEPHNDGKSRKIEVQCLLRGKRGDYGATLTKANAIYDAIDQNGPFTGASGAEYLDVTAVESTPIPLGPGESDAEYFALNFHVWFDP